jgi:cystathionine beta-lyase
MNNFDEIIDRKNTACAKWDHQGGDYIPLWIADMDFLAPKPIIEAIEKRLQHRIFGYTRIEDDFTDTIINFYKREYNYTIKKEWIVLVPSVMPGANIACRISRGDIIYSTPIYSHIRELPKEARCNVVDVPLKIENKKYTFDFEAMENAITDKVKAFVLCNPHNPVGRVYTYDELIKVVEFCEKHDLLLISDEIHSELIFEGKHIPAFTINEEAKERVITLTSGAKTYNLPGMPQGFAIIPNQKLRYEFLREAEGLFSNPSVLTMEGLKAAYNECGEWKRELIDYLIKNRDYIENRIEKIEGLEINHNEGTYLAWIDARKTGLENPYKFFLDKAGVKFSDGTEFGREGFVRINFACPRATLEQALDKVEKALKEK